MDKALMEFMMSQGETVNVQTNDNYELSNYEMPVEEKEKHVNYVYDLGANKIYKMIDEDKDYYIAIEKSPGMCMKRHFRKNESQHKLLKTKKELDAALLVRDTQISLLRMYYLNRLISEWL